MNDIDALAEKTLAEIREAENRMKALSSKKKWIKRVKKDPQKAASFYFEIFDNLVKYPSTNSEDWEKLSLLLHFKINPLFVKNGNNLNPLEYFYKRSREERLSLHDLPKKHQHLADQNELRFETISNKLYYTLKDFGLTDKQLDPIHKVQNLWHNYRRLINKQANTRRVAFSRLLKTVILHPEDAVTTDEFKQIVQDRLNQEKNDEKKAWQQWIQWEQKDYRARFQCPEMGHARGYSPFDRGLYAMFDGWKQYLLYQPLPASSKKALDDFLLSLKDVEIQPALTVNLDNGIKSEDGSHKLRLERVLSATQIRAYHRALHPPKKFERTR